MTPEEAPPRTGDAPAASADDAAEEAQLRFELTKMILAGNLEFSRATAQILQAFSAALLTASIAAIVALRAAPRFRNVPLLVGVLPSICFAGAFISLVVVGLARRQRPFVFGDTEGTLAAYQDVLSRRRKELRLPSALVGGGLVISLVVALVAVGGRSVHIPAQPHPQETEPVRPFSAQQYAAVRQLVPLEAVTISELAVASTITQAFASRQLRLSAASAKRVTAGVRGLRLAVGQLAALPGPTALRTIKGRLISTLRADATLARRVSLAVVMDHLHSLRHGEVRVLRNQRRIGTALSMFITGLTGCIAVKTRC